MGVAPSVHVAPSVNVAPSAHASPPTAAATRSPPAAALPFAAAYIISTQCASSLASATSQNVSAITELQCWPATVGSPALLQSSEQYLRRGVESYLYPMMCARLSGSRACGMANITGWGTIGNYLSHLRLLEHIATLDTAALVLQDDAELHPNWSSTMQLVLNDIGPTWERVQLVWFGAEREADCTKSYCTVRPPAGPTADGKRYYHGLQMYVIQPAGARCLVERLRNVQIKSIDALVVNAQCPAAYAVRKAGTLGSHSRWSEKARLEARWKHMGR